MNNYYLEKEARKLTWNKNSIYSFVLLIFFPSKVEAGATAARRFPGTDTLMHIALVRNLSPALEENVRSAFCAQVGGFICARCCQTTSQRLLTFGGLNKDFFFYQHAKKSILGRRTVHLIFFFIYLTFFFLGTDHKSEGQAKKGKK